MIYFMNVSFFYSPCTWKWSDQDHDTDHVILLKYDVTQKILPFKLAITNPLMSISRLLNVLLRKYLNSWINYKSIAFIIMTITSEVQVLYIASVSHQVVIQRRQTEMSFNGKCPKQLHYTRMVKGKSLRSCIVLTTSICVILPVVLNRYFDCYYK